MFVGTSDANLSFGHPKCLIRSVHFIRDESEPEEGVFPFPDLWRKKSLFSVVQELFDEVSV